MKDARWLLPCTNGFDQRAIDAVVRQAKSSGATIIAVSLCTAPSQTHASLERATQAEVFLQTVQHITETYQVAVECYQVFTRDAVRSIRLLTSDLRCSSLAIVVGEKRGVLLSTQEVRYLLLHRLSSSLVLIRLPLCKHHMPLNLATRFFPWLRRGLQPLAPTAVMHSLGGEEREDAGKRSGRNIRKEPCYDRRTYPARRG